MSKLKFILLMVVSPLLFHCGGASAPHFAPPDTVVISKAYFIGNSLIGDMNPPLLGEICQSRNVEMHSGYHINCGQSLTWIYAHPDETCIQSPTPPGTFGAALRQFSFDLVVFQPYPGATLKDDADTIAAMVGITQSKKTARFFVYQGWPQMSSLSYSDAWLLPAPNSDTTPTMLCREYYQRLSPRIASSTGVSVVQVPVGEVLFELDGMLKRGEIIDPKVGSAYDLYRDINHLNGTGRAIAGLTAFAALYARSPAGAVPPGYAMPTDVQGLDLAGRPEVQAMIWRVVQVSNHW